MKPSGRVISGGLIGAVLAGAAGFIDGNQDSAIITAVGGLIIGGVIAIIIVLYHVLPDFVQRGWLYVLIGGVLGGLGFALAGNFNIQGGNIINNSPSSFAIGFFVGALVSLSVSTYRLKVTEENKK